MRIDILTDDIRYVEGDVLLMKYANQFRGADDIVAHAIGYNHHLERGQHSFVLGNGVAASEVLFVGVGTLRDFNYDEIREFAKKSLRIIRKERPGAKNYADS